MSENQTPACRAYTHAHAIGSRAAAHWRANARRWHREAETLRDHAAACYLTQQQRAMLLREAAAADRQGNWRFRTVER